MHTSPEKDARRAWYRSGRALPVVALSALILAVFPAGAQNRGELADAASQITPGEVSSMGTLAEAHMADMEAAQLALEKSGSPQILAFARQEVDEHRAALEALRMLAQARGVSLPEETTIRNKSQSVALKSLSGSQFDRQYLKRIGISEHQRLMGLLREVQASAQDSALQALVEKMLLAAQSHGQKARQIAVQREIAEPASPS